MFNDADGVRGWASVLREDVAPALKNIGSLLGWASKWTLILTGGFAYLSMKWASSLEEIRTGATNLVTSFTDLGSRVIEGFIMGFTGGIPGTLSAVTSWALRTVGTARQDLKVRSPSKEFAEIGKYSAMGFQVGLDSMTPQLPSADAMVPNSLGGGGSSNSFSVVINVDGSKDPGETARMVRIEFESLLAGSFGRFAEGIA
jgi:hypothetical protein